MLEELSANDVLVANTPVIAKMKAGKEALSFSNSTGMTMLSSVTPATSKLTVIDWDGTSGLMKKNTNYDISCSSAYQPQEASSVAGLYTFNTDGSFGPQTSGTYRPFRLALTIKDNAATGGDSQAKVYNITIGLNDGSTTGIRELSATKANVANNNTVYNLSGNKVGTVAQLNQLGKGVYILNGKKIVIR